MKSIANFIQKYKNVLIMAGAYSAFLSGVTWFLGPYSYIPLHDTGDGQVPVYATYLQSIMKYGAFHWYPYHLGGVDESATYNAVSFLAPLFILFPIWLAYALTLFIQHFLAFVGGYFFAKNILKLPQIFSLLMAVAYTSPMVLPYFYDEAYQWGWNNYFEFRLCFGFFLPALPIFILAIDNILAKQLKLSKQAMLLTGLGLVMSLSMFFVAFYPYMILALFTFVLLFLDYSLPKKILAFIPISFGSLPPHLPALLFAGPLYKGSHRLLADVSIPPLTIPNSLFGDTTGSFFQKIITLLQFTKDFFTQLSTHTLIYHPFLPYVVLFVLTSILTLIILPTGSKTSYRLKERSVLLFSFYIFFIYNYLSSIIQTIVVHYQVPGLFKRIDLNYTWGLGVKFAASILFVIAINDLYQWLSRQRWSHLTGKFVITAAFAIALIPAVKYQLISLGHLLINGSAQANYHAKEWVNLAELSQNEDPFRVAVFDKALRANYLNPEGVESFGGHENLYSKRMAEYFIETIRPQLPNYFETLVKPHTAVKNYSEWRPFIGNKAFISRTGDNLDEVLNLNLLGLANVKFLVSDVPLNHSRLELWSSDFSGTKTGSGGKWAVMTLKGIRSVALAPPLKWLLNQEAKFHLKEMDQYTANITGRTLYVYEIKGHMPRARLVFNAKAISPQQVLSHLSSGTVAQLTNTVFLEDGDINLPKGCAPSDHHGKVKWSMYSPERLILEVESPCDGILVLAQSYSPFWRARINGESARVFPANHAFTGINIPKGSSRVELTYKFELRPKPDMATAPLAAGI